MMALRGVVLAADGRLWSVLGSVCRSETRSIPGGVLGTKVPYPPGYGVCHMQQIPMRVLTTHPTVLPTYPLGYTFDTWSPQ